MRMSTKERYEHDAYFRAIVDQTRAVLQSTEMTATELREAVMLGCEMYEAQHILPMLIRVDGGWRKP
jgi:hypothetical protein